MNIVHSECLHYVICPRRLNKEIKVLCNTKVQPFMIWLNGEGFWELNFRYWLLNNLFTSLHTSVNFTHCGFHSFPPWQVEWIYKIQVLYIHLYSPWLFSFKQTSTTGCYSDLQVKKNPGNTIQATQEDDIYLWIYFETKHLKLRTILKSGSVDNHVSRPHSFM